MYKNSMQIHDNSHIFIKCAEQNFKINHDRIELECTTSNNKRGNSKKKRNKKQILNHLFKDNKV